MTLDDLGEWHTTKAGTDFEEFVSQKRWTYPVGQVHQIRMALIFILLNGQRDRELKFNLKFQLEAS